ncbi:MAG: hypothetical protein OXR67_07860 [Chloroflexota bacterium]|nr:hypothetical protein [Chloroflexota bacterium]
MPWSGAGNDPPLTPGLLKGLAELRVLSPGDTGFGAEIFVPLGKNREEPAPLLARADIVDRYVLKLKTDQ